MTERITFSRAANHDLGLESPRSLVTADFNNDGVLDVAAGDRPDFPADPTGLAILLGDGQGGFAAPNRLAVGADRIGQLAAGDLNGDGNADLALVDQTNGVLKLLPGDGAGNFSSPRTLNVNAGHGVALADLNRDGAPDLVTGDGENVTTLVNDGAGQFPTVDSTAHNLATAFSFAIADLDGDGALDVATVNGGFFGRLTVLRGDGQGGLADPTTVELPGGGPDEPFDVVAGDFDADGAADLAAAMGARDTVAVLLNDGQGGFQAAVEYDTGNNPVALEAGDFDHDGRLDLATSNFRGRDVSVLRGDGRGGFTAESKVVNDVSDDSPRTLATGDLDGDGFTDLFVGNDDNGAPVSVLRNQEGDGLAEVALDLAWTRQPGSPAADTVVDLAATADGGAVLLTNEEAGATVRRFGPEGDLRFETRIGDDAQSGAAVATDDEGNIYLLGNTTERFFGRLDNHFTSLDGGDARGGIQDPFLAKLGPSGGVAWIEQFGSTDLDTGVDLTVDDDGNIYVTASARGAFAPWQSNVLEPDVMVARFEDGGGMQWNTLIGNLSDPEVFGQDDSPAGIAFDPANARVIVTGTTDGTFQQPAVNGAVQTSPDHSGAGPAFALGLDTDGELRFTRQFAADRQPGANAVAANDQGQFAVVGGIGGPLTDTALTPATGAPFAVGFDSQGNTTFARQDMSRNGGDTLTDVVAGTDGLFYAGGKFFGSSSGFISVYDGEGNLLLNETEAWFENRAPGQDDGGIRAIAQAPDGTLYVAGNTSRAWAGEDKGGEDAWLARLDPSVTAAGVLDLAVEGQLSALYLGYFGRAPDPAGLAFWRDQYLGSLGVGRGEGDVMKDIAESFRLDQEARSRFPFLAPDEAATASEAEIEGFIRDVYDNLFNRAPTQAGLEFWTGQIATRLDQGVDLGRIVIDIIAGARNQALDLDGDGEAEAVRDKTAVVNKIAVAEAFGTAIAGEDFTDSQARSVLDGVGDDPATVEAALSRIAELSGDQTLSTAVDPLVA